MEFKDKLKTLRKEKGLTQAQLAEQLFVSRSTVAKWENGLGLPNPEAMQALEAFFVITKEAITTEEPETVIVEKNRKIRFILRMIGWAAMIALLVWMYMLPFAIHNGDYGFTPDMAAGAFADSAYIDTGDYRIYYFTFEGDWEDGRHWSDLQAFKIVRKHFWGCTVSDEDYAYRIVTKDNYVVARIYSIKGKHGYYNIIHKAKIYDVDNPGNPLIWDIPAELICAKTITVSGVEYSLQDGFFFITQEPVEYFKIGDQWYDVE